MPRFIPNFLHISGKTILSLANISVGLAMIISAFAGAVDSELFPVVAIAGMTYPVWVPLMLLAGIADALWMRRWAIWVGIVFALTLSMTVKTLPVNIPRGPVPKTLKADSWTLMSYNVAAFMDVTDLKSPVSPNPTLNYILFHSPDVVILQEVETLPTAGSYGVTQAQVDSLNATYPTILLGHGKGHDITLFSKFPAERLSDIEQIFSAPTYPGNQRIGVFRLTIDGQAVLLIGVHLQSIGLTTDDKELYGELTRGEGITNREEIKAAKTDLLSKLAEANAIRGKQAKIIADAIDSLDIENVIVAGDFNDVPGCFAYRQLEQSGLRAVYPQVGSGYKMTFNADRFYFMIDHIFVKGNFVPWSIKRGDLKTSDHYPQLVTFVKTPDRHFVK